MRVLAIIFKILLLVNHITNPLLARKRLFRYYQIETKLGAMQRYEWTRRIPPAPVTVCRS